MLQGELKNKDFCKRFIEIGYLVTEICSDEHCKMTKKIRFRTCIRVYFEHKIDFEHVTYQNFVDSDSFFCPESESGFGFCLLHPVFAGLPDSIVSFGHPGAINQHFRSHYRPKYSFYSEMFNGNVVQFIERNNFCINTFLIGPIV